MVRKSLIVFDMDGVLVDVGGSYREAVRHAAACFLAPAAAVHSLPQPLFSLSDLAAVKQSGGLNNDWDLTWRVIALLFTQVELPVDPSRAADPWQRYRETLARCNVAQLGRFLTQHAHPLATLLASVGSAKNRFVDSLYENDVGSGNVIKQIFQEIYLGGELFTATYGLRPQMISGRGLITNETPLIERGLLEKLAARHVLAVATGRPASEARYALKRFGVRALFATVLTLDDCLRHTAEVYRRTGRKISFCKPSPYMLEAIAGQVADRVAKRFYIGDLPDDVAAAKAASTPYESIGLLAASPDRETLRHDLALAGADHIIETAEELAALLL